MWKNRNAVHLPTCNISSHRRDYSLKTEEQKKKIEKKEGKRK